MRRNNIMACVLFAESLLFPLLCLISCVLGYSLSVTNGIIYAAVTTVISIAASIFMIVSKDAPISKCMAVLILITLLLNQISTVLFIFQSTNSTAALLHSICFIFTVIVTAIHVKCISLKTTFYIVSGLLVFPILLMLLFSSLATNSVVKTVISHDGMYCAEVIDSDQGTLGGNTLVNVYNESQSFEIGSFAFKKEKQRVYLGDWGEFENMDIYWNETNELVINGKAYFIEEWMKGTA